MRDNLRRLRRGLARDESGLTLVELLVSMMLFSIVIGVYMAAIAVMTKDTARVQAVSDASDDLRRAFQQMDKQIRYASALNRPGETGGVYYLEFLTTAVEAGETAFCTQWKVDANTGLLQSRTWPDTSVSTPTTWGTVATDVRVDAVAGPLPFEFEPADSVYTRQRLTVALDAGPADRTGAQIESQFVARNSNTLTQTNADVDSDGVTDAPVCTQVGRS